MKIKNIAALCKNRNTIYLYDAPEINGFIQQWIGDGNSFYPITNLPYMSISNVCNLFELSAKQLSDFNLQHETLPDLNFKDNADYEIQLDPDPIWIIYQGKYLKPWASSEKPLYVEGKYLKPLADAAEYLKLFERRSSTGQPYIVAKTGFILAAVIMPCDVITEAFVDAVESLARRSRRELNTRGYHADKVVEQMTLMYGGKRLDTSTGEVLEEEEEES